MHLLASLNLVVARERLRVDFSQPLVGGLLPLACHSARLLDAEGTPSGKQSTRNAYKQNNLCNDVLHGTRWEVRAARSPRTVGHVPRGLFLERRQLLPIALLALGQLGNQLLTFVLGEALPPSFKATEGRD